jgi:hypothetical protein
MLAKLADFSHNNFYCEKCDYICFRKNDFEKHLLTQKHIAQKCLVKVADYTCSCGKKYKHKQSLNRHKMKCNYDELKKENNDEKHNIEEDNEENKIIEKQEISSDLIVNLIKENQELRAQVSELIPKIGNNNTNIHNNQKFNIQVFLNEKCKDAINMNDFIKSIEISLEQLDFTKKKGLTTGLSNAIVENMNKLSLHQRPMHCTDIKRETLYIKEDDKWEKDISKEKIKKAIKKASNKNYNALQEWKLKNPDFLENNEKQEFFTHVISEIGKPIDKIEEKIIKNLCKQTYVKDKIN